MTTYVPPEIDFSTFPESDGEPMAETVENMQQMIDLIFALGNLLRARGRARVAVGGNQFLYYNPFNGRDHVSPDVYVALDVEPGNRPTWKTWMEGKCPDIVFEITSPSTQNEDTGRKRELYARLGALEYYIYDPQDALRPRFQGYELRAGELEPRQPLPTGGIRSSLLGVELRPIGTYLRVIDPATGEPMFVPGEIQGAYETAQARLDRAEQARLEEQQARYAAEQRAAQAEAELRELRAALAQSQGRDAPTAEA